jgi:molybdopterin-binding protein
MCSGDRLWNCRKEILRSEEHLPVSNEWKKVWATVCCERRLIVKVSARNMLRGKVKSIVLGPVSSEITVELPGGTEIVSMITGASVERLGLTEGKEADLLIKASHVMLAVD